MSVGVGSLSFHFEKYVQAHLAHFKTKTDFKSLNKLHFNQFYGGQRILTQFQGFHNFLLETYPFRLSILDLQKATRNFWNLEVNQKFTLEVISLQNPLSFSQSSDWVRLLDLELLKNYCGEILIKKNYSILNLLVNNFPAFFWEKDSAYPDLSEHHSRRVLLDRLILPYLVEKQSDLLLVVSNDLCVSPGGHSMVNAVSSDISAIYRLVYPELSGVAMKWIEEGMKRMGVDRMIVEFFGFVENQQDLSLITVRDLLDIAGGRTILYLNEDSIQSVFQNMYPELIPRYKKMYSGFWKNLKLNNLLMVAQKFFAIKHSGDWYRISVVQISKFYGKTVSKRKLIKLLEYYHPEEDWDYNRFSERLHKKARQRFLGVKLLELFKNEVIHEEYVFDNKRGMIFDFYLPDKNILIEYQGEQHYFTFLSWWSLEQRLKKDEEKRIFCLQNGIKLVNVPYWWDNSLHTLKDIFAEALNTPITV